MPWVHRSTLEFLFLRSFGLHRTCRKSEIASSVDSTLVVRLFVTLSEPLPQSVDRTVGMKIDRQQRMQLDAIRRDSGLPMDRVEESHPGNRHHAMQLLRLGNRPQFRFDRLPHPGNFIRKAAAIGTVR